VKLKLSIDSYVYHVNIIHAHLEKDYIIIRVVGATCEKTTSIFLTPVSPLLDYTSHCGASNSIRPEVVLLNFG
jgi:hypothetical protein